MTSTGLPCRNELAPFDLHHRHRPSLQVGCVPDLGGRDLHRRRAGAATDEVRGRGEQRVHLVPARRCGVDACADRDRGPSGRRARAGGHRLRTRDRAHPGGLRQDPRGRRKDDDEALPGRDPGRRDGGGRRQGGRCLRGSGDRGRPGADGPGPGRPARGLRRPDDGDPRPACRLLALRRPGLLAGRQGRDRHGLPEGQRRGRHDSRPRRFLARHRVRSWWRAPGQDHGRRRLRRGRHQGLRGHQRHAAAGRGHARDRPPDPDLPLADLPVHPADGGDLCRAPRSLPRLRPLRARGDDQRAVQLDHVDHGAGGGHRLRASDRRQIPRGASPHAGSARGDGGRDAIGGAGRARIRCNRDRRALLPDDREGQRHLRHGPDRRDGRGLRSALDAHPAARAAHDLRPPGLLAIRPALDGVARPRGRAGGPYATAHRGRAAHPGAAARDRRFADRPAAAAAGDPQLAAQQGHARRDPVVDRRAPRPQHLQALRAAPLQARALRH